MTKTHSAFDPVPFGIRPTMRDSIRHRAQHLRRYRAAVDIENTRDTAHIQNRKPNALMSVDEDLGASTLQTGAMARTPIDQPL